MLGHKSATHKDFIQTFDMILKLGFTGKLSLQVVCFHFSNLLTETTMKQRRQLLTDLPTQRMRHSSRGNHALYKHCSLFGAKTSRAELSEQITHCFCKDIVTRPLDGKSNFGRI